MSGRPGETTGRVKREIAVERHERAVHLVDGEAIRRALLGSPVALTELERGAVISIASMDGFDRELSAQGLGVSRNTLDSAIAHHRRRLPGLTRDLWAATALRPAGALVEAVASQDAGGVASVLCGLDRQRLAALAVVLAAAVTDPSILPDTGDEPTGIPIADHAGV